MREIEFRGKRLYTGEWVHGAYGKGMIDVRDDKEAYKHYIMIWNIPDEKWVRGYFTDYEVDPATVGQYTGLRDKAKNKAYEDDIIDTPVGKAMIKFGEYSQPTGREWHVGFHLEFELEQDIATLRKDIGFWMPQSRIIGNTHDNPELLGNI